MNNIITFKNRGTVLEVGSFDIDKEVEFSMSINDFDDSTIKTIWLNANQINELINHLAQCLNSVDEPVELLNIN